MDDVSIEVTAFESSGVRPVVLGEAPYILVAVPRPEEDDVEGEAYLNLEVGGGASLEDPEDIASILEGVILALREGRKT